MPPPWRAGVAGAGVAGASVTVEEVWAEAAIAAVARRARDRERADTIFTWKSPGLAESGAGPKFEGIEYDSNTGFEGGWKGRKVCEYSG